MKTKKVEAWAWILIYSGLLLISLGLFLRQSAATAGVVLIVLGGADTVAGIVLIWLRSRMKQDTPETS